MERSEIFQSALSNFATDVACGGAIRHLADLGFTLEQIVERLDYPTPRSKAQKIMMEYMYESRLLLRQEPSGGILDGRRQDPEPIWKEIRYDPARDGKLTAALYRKCEENGEDGSYMSCAFGFLNNDRSSQEREKVLGCLNSRQREYLAGILWEQPVVYHRINRRMLEIIGKLYEAGAYAGACFFAVRREKVVIAAG